MIYLESTPSAEENYKREKYDRITKAIDDEKFNEISADWRTKALERKYMNNFAWLGRPLIQLPQDAMAIQELIWNIKPDFVIETGVAHGGSLILSGSILKILGKGKVIGIDIELRSHNKREIENHPVNNITLIEGSSIDSSTFKKVQHEIQEVANPTILVILDSNHTHDHVLRELEMYSPLVSKSSYIVVLDTFIEDMPDSYSWENRPWSKGDNAMTAVNAWLPENPQFEVDKTIEAKLMITSAPRGFLRKTS